MKTIIFAAAGYNLAETTRMIEFAKACKEHFRIIFMSYGGRFKGMIKEEGFSLKKMEPRLTDMLKMGVGMKTEVLKNDL